MVISIESLSSLSVTPENLRLWSSRGQIFIDVRAPVEFHQGHIPLSINAPILSDEERAQVGLTYKRDGQDAAIERGQALVSGDNRETKIKTWEEILRDHPEAILTCFRGGLRSRTTQGWLKERGWDRPLLNGGYKAIRQAFLEQIEKIAKVQKFLLLSGPTGAGKTRLLHRLSASWPVADLEAYAEHRGSAFGSWGGEQPQQAVFENRLAWQLFRVESDLQRRRIPLILEDESRLIGRCVQPEVFFERLRSSPILWLDEPLERRVENTFEDYILNVEVREALFQRYKQSLGKIRNRLGGLRYKKILSQLESCENAWKSRGELDENRVWIESLLIDYYDPLYFGSLDRRNPEIVLKAPSDQVFDFLSRQENH